MIQTDFIVSDNNSTSSDTNDDFLYKVVVYLTTGKIMIQGKSYEAFCDGYFNTYKTDKYILTGEQLFIGY